jgi:hypothetical protein
LTTQAASISRPTGSASGIAWIGIAGLEGGLEVGDGVLDAAAGGETELVADALGGDVEGAMVVARRRDDLDLIADLRFHHVGDLGDLEIVIARIPGLAVDRRIGRLEQPEIEVGHVVDMDVGPQLLAAEHRDPPIC